MKNCPTPDSIRAAREAAKLTQTQAAELIFSTWRTWQQWEADTDKPAHRAMHPGLFELFLLKTGQALLHEEKMIKK